MGVPRGTTPTFTLTFPQDSAVNLTEAVNVYVTFSCNRTTITKTGEDLEVAQKSVSVFLSQTETLAFSDGAVDIQVNWTTLDGKRMASDVVTYTFNRQLLLKEVE